MCVCVCVSERKSEGMRAFDCVLGGGATVGDGGRARRRRFSHVADSKTHACSHIHTYVTQM